MGIEVVVHREKERLGVACKEEVEKHHGGDDAEKEERQRP